MGVSINPEKWERLKDLREQHALRARRADEVHRLFDEGLATEEELAEADRLERAAYADWRALKWPPDPELDERQRELPEQRDDVEVPRDL